jgi:O-acetyl-ADP-ribose deacetylase (regulator of RNase III)
MSEVAIGSRRIRLVRGDITALNRHVGAIVNAADQSLRPDGGVSAAIHTAGGREIAVECLWIGGAEATQAVATTAGKLDADAVIHAVGPAWHGGHRDEDKLLSATYRNCLEVASQRGLTSIAFPSLSAGILGYPIDRVCMVAIGTAAAYLKRGGPIEEIILVQYTDEDHQVYVAALDRWQRLQASRAAAMAAAS